MPGTENTLNPETPPTVIFDEGGAAIDPALEGEIQPLDANAPEAPIEEVLETPEHTYRIGEKTFATQAEALAYANSAVVTLETEAQVADAYRRGVQEAIQHIQPMPGVTPPAAPQVPAFNADEYYGDPQAFLDKFAKQIQSQTIQTINSQQSMQQQSDQIWGQFAGRHPGLSDFRREVESYVEQNKDAVRAIFATKGDGAGFDYIAMKLRSQFARYAETVKPQRALPNGGGGASPSGKGPGVTPVPGAKKPLTFAEQLRSIKRKR